MEANIQSSNEFYDHGLYYIPKSFFEVDNSLAYAVGA